MRNTNDTTTQCKSTILKKRLLKRGYSDKEVDPIATSITGEDRN